MPDIIPPDLQARIAQLRAKSLEGTITLEEMREAVAAVRAGRLGAQAAAAKSGVGGGRVKREPKSADALFAELGMDL